MNNNLNDVAIIILNYKSWRETLDEVSILHNLFHLVSNQIYVVDNNSPNDSAEQLSKVSSDNFQLILSNMNSGYAAGNNLGLKRAYADGYKFALILNNDIIFKDDKTIIKLKSIFLKDKSVGVISPDVYYPNGKLYNRNSIRPDFWQYTFGIVSYKRKCRIVTDLGGYGYVYRPQGCCMMLDLEKVNEIDFLDENTFLYCEEPILSERLLKMNYKTAVCLTTSIIHNHSETVKSSIKTKEIERIKLKSHNYLLSEYRHFSKVAIFIVNLFDRVLMRITG